MISELLTMSMPIGSLVRARACIRLHALMAYNTISELCATHFSSHLNLSQLMSFRLISALGHACLVLFATRRMMRDTALYIISFDERARTLAAFSPPVSSALRFASSSYYEISDAGAVSHCLILLTSERARIHYFSHFRIYA
jgi:hypothetical protein